MTRIGDLIMWVLYMSKNFKVDNCFSDLNWHGSDVRSILKVGWKGLMPFITCQRGSGGESLYNSMLLSPFQLDF